MSTPDQNILVALSTFCEHDNTPLQILEKSGLPFSIHDTGKRITPAELRIEGRHATVIVAGVETYDAQTLGELPDLKCISRCGVGTDAIDLDAARSRGITVLNTPDVPTNAVAELALSMFLALSRNLKVQANIMQAHRWERVESHLLNSKTVGVIGLGRIGRRVAFLARQFGASVVATDPQASAESATALGISLVGLDELLQVSDIISLHAAKSSKAPLRLDEAEMRRMKRGAIIVNLARGDMVSESALLDALRTGHLAGAGLDVFESEPYSGPLCDLDQVLLTPHSATLPVETRVAMEIQCVQNALDFTLGTPDPDFRVV